MNNVISFYPYSVRALSELSGADIIVTYRSWKRASTALKTEVLTNQKIIEMMLELIALDSVLPPSFIDTQKYNWPPGAVDRS